MSAAPKTIRHELNEALHERGASFSTPKGVALIAMQWHIRMLNLEVKTGMRATRRTTAHVKREYGLKGTKERVLEQLIALYKSEVAKHGSEAAS